MRKIQSSEGISTISPQFKGTHPDFTGELGDDSDNLNYFKEAYYTELTQFSLAANTITDDPKTLSEAQNSINWPKWKEAMNHEIQTLTNPNTWTIIPKPPG